MSAVFILTVNTISRYLKSFLAKHNRYGSMLDSGIYRPWKYSLYLQRSGRGRDIPVIRHSAKQRIPDTAAHCIGLKARLFQSLNDVLNLLR